MDGKVMAHSNGSGFDMESGSPVAGFVLLMAAFVIYFTPTFVAAKRKHRTGNSIFLVNLLLGWTALGWVAALVWSVSENTEQKQPAAIGSSSDRICPMCAEIIKRAAIKCKHCGADVTPDDGPDPVIQKSQSPATGSAEVNSGVALKDGNNALFVALCSGLMAIIIGAIAYHLLPVANAPSHIAAPVSFQALADDLVFLDDSAFGCVSATDFNQSLFHYNQSEFTAWADRTSGENCFHQKNLAKDIRWTVLQVRDDLMQVGLKRPTEYAKEPRIGQSTYWTLARWASPNR